MKKIKIIKITVMFFMTVIFTIGYGTTDMEKEMVQAVDGDRMELRVGLEGLYYNKASVTVNNRILSAGYVTNEGFLEEVSLEGGPFIFEPVDFSYYISEEFATYEQAKKKADSSSDSCVVLSGRGNFCVAVKNQGAADGYSVLVKASDGGELIYSVDGNNEYPQFGSAVCNEKDEKVIDLGERQYRGRIEIGRYNKENTLKVVNIVELEEYLYGVVPCEMTSGWHEEALKAQAVCARSYVSTAEFGGHTNLSKPYQVCDTTSDQVYRGYGAENERTNKAVNDTKGQKLFYKGSPVKAYYSSTSGGSTENVEDVWGTPSGYLRQVPDIYELNPELKPWKKELTKSDIIEILKENGIDVGDIKDIHPSVYTKSGRVYSVDVTGTKGNYSISGEKLRKYLSLYSTKYKVVKYGENPDYVAVLSAGGTTAKDIGDSYILSGNYSVQKPSSAIEQYVVMTADNLINYPKEAPENSYTYYMEGMGYGHGVGLSQSGARGMAEAGFTYTEILKHYYTDIEIR